MHASDWHLPVPSRPGGYGPFLLFDPLGLLRDQTPQLGLQLGEALLQLRHRLAAVDTAQPVRRCEKEHSDTTELASGRRRSGLISGSVRFHFLNLKIWGNMSRMWCNIHIIYALTTCSWQ